MQSPRDTHNERTIVHDFGTHTHTPFSPHRHIPLRRLSSSSSSTTTATTTPTTTTMSHHDEEEHQHLLYRIPWMLVLEFCTLPECLQCRLVSHDMAGSVQDISPSQCATFWRQHVLGQKGPVPSILMDWNRPAPDPERLFCHVGQSTTTTTSSLDVLLRCFRVLRHLPNEALLAVSGRYGRHCWAMERCPKDTTRNDNPKMGKAGINNNNNKQQQLVLGRKVYPPCRRRRTQRGGCATCRLVIPSTRERHDMDQYIQIQTKGRANTKVDLARVYPKCIPNLPADLICPVCRVSTERTLVLSIRSYQSSSVSVSTPKPLTYTPQNQEDYDEEEDEDGTVVGDNTVNSNDTEQGNHTERPAKKQRIGRQKVVGTNKNDDDDNNQTPFSNSLPYDELPLLDVRRPISEKPDSKFAISIHCTSCHQFGMVKPANPCSHPSIRCPHRARPEGDDGLTACGVFVAVPCTNHKCDKSPLCQTCASTVSHEGYPQEEEEEEAANDEYSDDEEGGDEYASASRGRDESPDRLVYFKSNCTHCFPNGEGRFCRSCSWMTTCCHHW